MLCPSCQNELRISERQGIEIDYCPKCRGIWLDRGELDKLLERAERRSSRDDDDDDDYEPRRSARRDESSGYDRPRHDSDDGRDYRSDQRPYKRESWLSNLFDWD